MFPVRSAQHSIRWELMKRLVALLIFASLCVSCSVSAYARSNNHAKAQARANQKAAKKQQKALRKYMKAQQKAQRKMAKRDRKNTHYPKRSF
jgi:hypothetical protein